MKNLIRTVLVFIFCFAFPQAAFAQEVNSGLSDSCSFCGFCPEPLGLCLFFYVIAFLVILFFLVLLHKKVKKCPLCKEKNDPDAQMCPKCGYDFDSGLQSTLTIRVADSPELMKLQEESKKNAEEAVIPNKAEVTDSNDMINNEDTYILGIEDKLKELISEEIDEGQEAKPVIESRANKESLEEPIQPEEQISPLPLVNEVKRCSECGAELIDNANFCDHCGHPQLSPLPLVNEVKICSKCGAELVDEARFCGQCGNPQ